MTNKRDRRSLILDAACNVIGRYGLQKTTMEDIARGAGIKAASIYHYFNSKEEVFAAAIHRESEAMVDRVDGAVGGATTAAEKLVAFVSARYGHLSDLRVLYDFDAEVVLELLPLANAARKEFLGRELAVLGQILAAGVEQGEFEIEDVKFLALVILSSVRGLDATFILYGVDEQFEKALPTLLHHLVHGIARRTSSDGGGSNGGS